MGIFRICLGFLNLIQRQEKLVTIINFIPKSWEVLHKSKKSEKSFKKYIVCAWRETEPEFSLTCLCLLDSANSHPPHSPVYTGPSAALQCGGPQPGAGRHVHQSATTSTAQGGYHLPNMHMWREVQLSLDPFRSICILVEFIIVVTDF